MAGKVAPPRGGGGSGTAGREAAFLHANAMGERRGRRGRRGYRLTAAAEIFAALSFGLPLVPAEGGGRQR